MSVLTSPTASHQHSFLALLPTIQRHAQFAFRRLHADAREEAVAEVVAAAFLAFVKVRRAGKDPGEFPSLLATFAVLHVRGFRQVGARSNSRDVLSAKAQHRHGFQVHSLHGGEITGRDDWQDAVVDNTQTPVPDQASFRLAFPTFLGSLSLRDRKLARFLAVGNSAKDAAAEFGVSAVRITQLRQRWRNEWRRLHDEVEDTGQIAPA